MGREEAREFLSRQRIKKTKNNVKCTLYWRVNDKITELWVIRWTASIQRVRHDHRKTNQSFRFIKQIVYFSIEKKNQHSVEREENAESNGIFSVHDFKCNGIEVVNNWLSLLYKRTNHRKTHIRHRPPKNKEKKNLNST